MVNSPSKTFKQYLEYAYRLALQSPDLSTQNGAVIVRDNKILGQGHNTLPFGVQITEERLQRPLKYAFTEHAERNAIFDAAKRGAPLQGAIMFCPWFACADCGRAIIQAGIRAVYGHKKMFDQTPDHWKESIEHSFTMFKEAGVQVGFYIENDDNPPLNVPPIRFNEQLWKP